MLHFLTYYYKTTCRNVCECERVLSCCNITQAAVERERGGWGIRRRGKEKKDRFHAHSLLKAG
jgi:hypothetical protein